ncbi:MAG: hypothetical protein NZM35_06920 [Chitinophagales bacterium]|nr:hypothetical protein [Chitinophagales bacterium]MDW8419774.1 hypothetical protein [Chitinophagales bacterium]
MKQTAIKILAIFLTTIIVFNFTYGHITIDEKEIKFVPDTEYKVAMIIDSLTGTWELVRTIRYENGDTIIQEPSVCLWLTPQAKPYTTIRIYPLRNFEIEQVCMKCPYLFWKGQFEIEIRNFRGLGLFYIKFVDNRLKNTKSKKQKNAITLIFNGYLTNFENGELTITDDEGTEWIYKRQ